MYEQIGEKIKGLASTLATIGIIISIFGGIVLMMTSDDAPILGIFVAAIGALLSWVSSWLLYGFGELIDKVCNIEKSMHIKNRISETSAMNISKRLDKIETLRAEGLITNEEYQAAVSKED